MKVVIILEDTPHGIYPVMSWEGNGITDHLSDSLSMILSAQIANMMRISSQSGALKVVEKGSKMN